MPRKKNLAPEPRSESLSIEQVYQDFISGLEIYAIWLKTCTCSVDRDAVFSLNEDEINIFKQSYELAKFNNEHFEAEGRYEFRIVPSENAEAVATIQCSFVAHIHSDKGLSEEHAHRFSQSELRLVLMPYARHFVSNITSQMLIPPVILPLSKRTADKTSV